MGFRETTNAFALVQVIALVRLGMNRPYCTLEAGIDWELASPGHLNSQPKSQPDLMVSRSLCGVLGLGAWDNVWGFFLGFG